jgi:HK97 family phage major capsid protein
MLKELRSQMANIATLARAKFDEIKPDTPAERAAEIEREFDAMMADHDKLAERVARAEKLDRAERAANAIATDVPRPNVPEQRSNGELTYADAFADYFRAGGVLGDMEPEARAVLKRGVVTGVEKRAQTSSSNAAGLYTVPDEMMGALIRSLKMWGPMYDEDLCTTITTVGGAPLPMPTVNDTANSAAANGGQGVTLTDDGGADVTFGQKQLDAYAFDTEWIRVSKELADDSMIAMEALLASLLGERLGRTANSQLTVGTGSSAPNGIVTASTLGKTAAGAAAITADEIMDLLHSVDPAYRMSPKARFMFNDSTFAAIRKLKDGQNNYLWQMGDVRTAAPGTLLGYSYTINQAMASLATGNKVMLFGDFSKYFVRKVGGVLIGAIQDKDFWPGFGIAGWVRFDGELGDTAAVKHLITA